jgi:hypothetical protein
MKWMSWRVGISLVLGLMVSAKGPICAFAAGRVRPIFIIL